MMEVQLKANFKGTQSLLYPMTKKSTCVMLISVGWDYHEGESFKSTLKLVDENFSSCRIVVADTLQRHSLQFFKHYLENEHNNVNEYARSSGDGWIKHNLAELDNLSIHYKIERWDDYLHTQEYDI